MFYGNRVVLLAAGGCVLAGLVLIPALFLTSVLWTGTAVHGVERGGLVYYRYRGQLNTIDKTSRFTTNTVYLDPEHPASTAQLGDTYAKALDVVAVTVPFVAAVLVLAYGFRRREKLDVLTWPVDHLFDPTRDG